MNPRRFVVTGIVLFAIIGVGLLPDVRSALPAGRGPAAALGAPWYVEETATSGVDHVYGGGFEYATGGGVSAFDCNGDGKPDLYIAGGSGAAALYRNESPIGGALRFARMRDAATDLTGATGAAPAAWTFASATTSSTTCRPTAGSSSGAFRRGRRLRCTRRTTAG